MPITIDASGQACGATVSGIDLSRPLSETEVATLRAAWLTHHVLAFPSQGLTDDQLETFAGYFGPFGEDPFIAPIPSREHIIAVKRGATETAPIFAEAWHTDWSFQATPPAGTCLYSLIVPPKGGDTLFINQHKALAAMPKQQRQQLMGLQAIHSAKAAYAPEGMYGDGEIGSDRSMVIVPSERARETQLHPIIRTHAETGEAGIFGCLGYIIGIEGMVNEEAVALLLELYQWQTRPEFQYRHRWQANMLLLWDNRSVLHCATGGYEGHERLLHRVTVAER